MVIKFCLFAVYIDLHIIIVSTYFVDSADFYCRSLRLADDDYILDFLLKTFVTIIVPIWGPIEDFHLLKC